MILKNFCLEEIKGIVADKAKYQKVMLLYDDSFSALEVGEIYATIKELCIYNCKSVEGLDLQELNNGYKLIIYLMSADSYLKLNVKQDEFVNVFISSDAILPYMIDDMNSINNKDYLLIKNMGLDKSMLSSIHFNNFYN